MKLNFIKSSLYQISKIRNNVLVIPCLARCLFVFVLIALFSIGHFLFCAHFFAEFGQLLKMNFFLWLSMIFGRCGAEHCFRLITIRINILIKKKTKIILIKLKFCFFSKIAKIAFIAG